MADASAANESNLPNDAMPHWNYKPSVPLAVSPLFQWPAGLLSGGQWLLRSWLPVSEKLLIALIAIVSWTYFQPPLESAQNLELEWIALMWIRNIALMVFVAGGLHLYLYILHAQKDEHRYDSKPFGGGRPFAFGDQIKDNVFWTLASGVTVWTGYEALLIWGFASGHLDILNRAQNPLWFVLIFLLMPIWESFYFFLIHRLLHWKPLYRLAHHVHHRNVNVGPWSGLSMHPVEHLLFLGSVLIHWVIASHPVHVLFHLQYFALSAVTTHCGYESMTVRGKKLIRLGTFHHQIHHRFVHCNYGGLEFPWDKFTGTFHDGTDASQRRLRQHMRRQAKRLRARRKGKS